MNVYVASMLGRGTASTHLVDLSMAENTQEYTYHRENQVEDPPGIAQVEYFEVH
jgi:hypothetical protein